MKAVDCRSAEDIRAWLQEAESGASDLERAYLLAHGRSFAPCALPDKRLRRRAGQRALPKIACVINAQRGALEQRNLGYVEGYAVRRDDLLGVQFHAWNTDANDQLVDTTWDDAGIAYFGAPVVHSMLWAHFEAMDYRHWPVLRCLPSPV